MRDDDKRPWIQVSMPPLPGLAGASAYARGECRVILNREDGLWHLSISCADRYPTWDEIKDARYVLLPHNITVAMLLPPPGEYVNLHNNTFHLWELRE